MSPTTRVPPILRLAVLCEDVVFDADGHPFSLNVPVHTVQFPPGLTTRYRPPTPKLYLQLADGMGTFYLYTEVRNEGDTVQYRSRPPVEVVFDGTTHRAVPMEVVLTLEGLEVPGPGLYELLVVCNHVSLHDPRAGVTVPYPPLRLSVLPPDQLR
jgi:hypothetical protein